VTIFIQVTVTPNDTIQDAQSTVIDAILNYAAGLANGIPGLNIGNSVNCFEMSGAIVAQYPGIYVNLLEISDGSGFSTSPISIAPWEIANIVSSNIVVTVI
jgi:hypothetical protein